MAEARCNNSELLRKLSTPTRNKYFYGKLMDAFHFELEQKYVNQKRWLLNRMALGRGVLCGLQVAPTTDGKQVIVGPGAAIDDCGREIIVPAASHPLDPRQPTDDCGRPVGDRITGAEIVHLCLAYHECEGEPVPVLVGDCETRDSCAPSLIHERYKIIVHKGAAPEINPSCRFEQPFAPPQAGQQSSPLHGALVSRISQSCAQSQGAPCVVLAQISLPEGDASITNEMIDPSCRPVVYGNELLFELLMCLAQQKQDEGPAPSPKLTTITELSWPHDDSLSINDFVDTKLTVTFSDKVKAKAQWHDAWFIVTVEYPIQLKETQFPALMPGTVCVQRVLAEKIEVTGKTASFAPSKAFFKTFEKTFESIMGGGGDEFPLCRIVLKCNALSDGKERAVDGNFMCGILPSGDGIPGGDFESWFRLRR